ncbi:MAG: RES domain-containing protein [Balneolaceae bacterium]
MVVYRITLEKWADKLSGSGYAARWNPKGTFVIYTAESRALACLENLVHRSGEGLNKNFCLVEIEIEDDTSIETIDSDSLPHEWYSMTKYGYCQSLGNKWLDSQSSLLLRLPSSIIHDEFNVLINPHHSEFPKVSIKTIREFSFDDRLND